MGRRSLLSSRDGEGVREDGIRIIDEQTRGRRLRHARRVGGSGQEASGHCCELSDCARDARLDGMRRRRRWRRWSDRSTPSRAVTWRTLSCMATSFAAGIATSA